MVENDTPLTDAELDELDHFLLFRNRSNAELDAAPDAEDGEIVCIAGLDGLFAAINCCHELILPSDWILWIWGGGTHTPAWKSEEQAQHFQGLIMRHYNFVVGSLMAGPDYYEPLFMERKHGRKRHLIVDEWCEGFMLAIDRHPSGWDGHEADIECIAAFTERTDFAAHERKDVAALQQMIEPAVLRMHQRRLAMHGTHHQRPSKNEVKPRLPGRNEPCSCGSGKKYKKCCGWNLYERGEN